VSFNGTDVSAATPAERARTTRRAFADLEAEVLEQVDAGAHTAIVFRMRGRHVGPLATPLGEVPPTGRVVERQVIDVLESRDGRIAKVWMVGDDLGALVRPGALSLADRGRGDVPKA
jgi:ketosteroid isomerase-like protein